MQLSCNYMHCFTFYIGKHTPSHSHCIRRETRGSKEVHGKASPLPVRGRSCCCSAARTTMASWGCSGDTILVELPQPSALNCQRNAIAFFQQPKVHRAELKMQSPYDFLSLEPQSVGIETPLTIPLQWQVLREKEETLVQSSGSPVQMPTAPRWETLPDQDQ